MVPRSVPARTHNSSGGSVVPRNVITMAVDCRGGGGRIPHRASSDDDFRACGSMIFRNFISSAQDGSGGL